MTYELPYVTFFIYQGFCGSLVNFDIVISSFMMVNKYCTIKQEGQNYVNFSVIWSAGIMGPFFNGQFYLTRQYKNRTLGFSYPNVFVFLFVLLFIVLIILRLYVVSVVFLHFLHVSSIIYY